MSNTIDNRFVLAAGGHWRDLLTGRLVPMLSGSEGEEDEGGDEGGDDDDDEDEESAETKRLNAALTKANRTGGKRALRDLAKKYGFASRAELEAHLASAVGGEGDDDGDEDDDSGNDAAGDDSKPKPKRRSRLENSADREREIRLDIREALADADIRSGKGRLATAAVIGTLDLKDPDLDAEDVIDAIEALRESEPGWFLADDSGSGNGSDAGVVPGAGRKKNKGAASKSPDEIASAEWVAYKKRTNHSLSRINT